MEGRLAINETYFSEATKREESQNSQLTIGQPTNKFRGGTLCVGHFVTAPLLVLIVVTARPKLKLISVRDVSVREVDTLVRASPLKREVCD